jgi:hypothetical protein
MIATVRRFAGKAHIWECEAVDQKTHLAWHPSAVSPPLWDAAVRILGTDLTGYDERYLS